MDTPPDHRPLANLPTQPVWRTSSRRQRWLGLLNYAPDYPVRPSFPYRKVRWLLEVRVLIRSPALWVRWFTYSIFYHRL